MVPYALTGIAMRDPEQAWGLLSESDDAFFFISEWVRIEPERAVPFLEEKLGGSDRKELQYGFGMALLHTHPELAVHYLTKAGTLIAEDPFGPSEIPMERSQWPVVEGMKPGIPIEELQERWRKALDDQSAPPAIREMFNPLLKATD